MSAQGKVWLVGAGPGDPDLLTLRGAEVLRRADVVVYDALSPPELLALAPAAAERIDVGKRGHEQKTLEQAEISALLVERARAGNTVVRLKGGDPFVFGRGGEEASACVEGGVAFEVIPGVSAALAAAAYAGIPVTDRRHAASFVTVTGHKDPATSATQVRWRELALGADTIVILMGLRTLEGIVAELLKHGRDPATPAAAISRATTPSQQVVVASLSELPARVREAGLAAPATVVVGEVVRLRETLAWYERLPLFGRRVLVTRAEVQAGELLRALRGGGAEGVALPMLRIVPCDDWSAIDEALDHLPRYDAILFTSANAVRILASRAAERAIPLARHGLVVHCVGPITAEAAREAGLAVQLLPGGRYDAARLLETLRAEASPAGKRFLLPRSAAAVDALPDGLRAAGASVDAIPLYRPEPAPVEIDPLRAALREGRFDAITFTSPSTVRHFLVHLDPGARAALSCTVVAAIGPATASALHEAGLRVDVMPERSDAVSLVEALADHFARGSA